MKKVFIAVFMFICFPALGAEYSQDNGKISQLFVTPAGSLGFQLVGGKEGIPNAVTKFSCTSGGGWIGHATMDSVFKSVILAAKASDSEVAVTIEGCEGSWFKVKDVYVK